MEQMPGYLLNQKEVKGHNNPPLTHKTERVERTRCIRTPPYPTKR